MACWKIHIDDVPSYAPPFSWSIFQPAISSHVWLLNGTWWSYLQLGWTQYLQVKLTLYHWGAPHCIIYCQLICRDAWAAWCTRATEVNSKWDKWVGSGWHRRHTEKKETWAMNNRPWLFERELYYLGSLGYLFGYLFGSHDMTCGVTKLHREGGPSTLSVLRLTNQTWQFKAFPRHDRQSAV